MGKISWFDFIIPTTPFASIVFGCIITVIAAVTIWIYTKKQKDMAIALTTGLTVTGAGVFLLHFLGYYV